MHVNCSPTHQEVQVTLTMWVDITLSKEYIQESFINAYPEIQEISIKEEAEIYGNDPEPSNLTNETN